MAERGGFAFQPQGQSHPRRRGRGRGRGQGWGGGRGVFCYQSSQNPYKFGQSSRRPRTTDGLNPEGRQLSPRERFHTLLKLEVGISSKTRPKEEVLSPGSSSSSKRSCTEMEDNDANKTKVLIKKRCKKNLAGNFPCSRDSDGISKGKSPGEEVRFERNVIMSEGEDWDEEIRMAQLDGTKTTANQEADWDKGRTDNNETTNENIDGLMLVQESYPSSGSNCTEYSKNPDGDVELQKDDEVKQMSPRKLIRDKVVDCLSNAVTENCTCTSEEDIFKSQDELQNHALNKSGGVRSFSSPTAGSKMGPRLPSKSKSDSWTCSVLNQVGVRKKGKLKKKHRAVLIPEYQGSTDDDTEPNTNPAFHRSERTKNCKQKKGNYLKDGEVKGGCAGAVIQENDESEVKVDGPNEEAESMSKCAEDDGDSCQADDSLTDDESWNNVVKKLSADGVDAEEVQERRPFPPENDQTDQSMMDAPLSFRHDFRARFSYPPPTYMAYNHSHPTMRPSFPYGPPVWPMMGDPYFYGPAMMRGFHPDAISRYPVIHRFPRYMQPEVEKYPPNDPVKSPSNDSQDNFYTINESNVESRDYVHSINTTFDMNAYGGTDYTGKENETCEHNHGEEVYVSDFNSSGNQSYLSHDLKDETWRQEPNVSWEEKKTPLLQTPPPDLQEDAENLDTQSSFISTEDESDYYHPYPCESTPRAAASNFSRGMHMNSKEQSNHNWYNHGMETPATGFGPARRKSKVWGLNLKQMTRDTPGQKPDETKSYVSVPSNPFCASPQPLSSYANVVSAKTGTEHPGGQKRETHISSAHLEERRRSSYPGVTAPQSGWGSGHSLLKFVSPQNDIGITKEKPQENRFWQGTPSPVATETNNKFRSWSVGSQGWGTYNITPIPRPVSAPPKPKTFAEILQRPRRLTLEDEVRRETIPSLTSWRSSTEAEDSSEIQYPTSDIDYLDTHAHIDLLFQRHMFKGTFAKFCSDNKFPTNFAGCVAIFCYPVNFSNLYSLADNLLKESNIWGSFGCHPHQVKHYDGIMEQKIKDWMNHPKTVALGEIGLDYSDRPLETTSDHELQKMIFRRQLQIALDTKKPLVIHCRDAEADTLSIMSEVVPRNHKIHRHCFTGPPQDAITFLRAFPNSFIGLTALVTFPTATNTHQTARAIPLNRLLLETDTPYFLPRKVRGQRWSHPGMALLVAERIAQLRGTTLDDVLSNVRSNTMTMYGI